MNLLITKYTRNILPAVIILLIVSVFFYKMIVRGLVPFPGDILLSDISPWRHESYGGYNAGSIPTKGQYFDVIRQIYPWKTLAIEQIKKGSIPLWNPYNFSGSPLLANLQSQALYPLNIFYFLLPQVSAWELLIFLQPLLGMVFMYLYARKVGISRVAAVVSAILFNFSHFATVWTEYNTVWHTILWLPLLLYLTEQGIKNKNLTLFEKSLFVIGLYSSATAGHPQDFMNLFIFFILYILCRIASEKKWKLKDKILFIVYPLSTLILISLLIASPQILTTIEFYTRSARVAHDYKFIINTMLVQWWQLPLLVVADMFGNPATKTLMTNEYINKSLSIGSIGFILSISAILYSRKSWYKSFFLTTLLILLVFTFNSPLTQFLYSYPLPIVSTSTLTRILFLFAFSLSVLAGLGYDTILKTNKFKPKALIIMYVCISLFWLFAFYRPNIDGLHYSVDAFSIMKRALILPTSLLLLFTLIVLFAQIYKKILIALVILISIELFYSFIKFNPFVPKSFVFPENKLFTYLKNISGIDRSWGYGTARIEANFATQEQLFSTDGYDPLNLIWYNQFLQASTDGNIGLIFDRTTRSDAQIQPGYGVNELPSNNYRLRILDMMGIKYIIDRTENPKNDDTFSPERFKPIWHEGDWIIYENLLASPRFFLTSDVRPYTSIKDFENQLFSGDFKPSSTVLVDVKDYIDLSDLKYGNGTINLISYDPNRVVFTVISDSPQFLFISDSFDYGWHAYINGKKVTVHRANYALRGIKIPQGSSQIEFIYLPFSFQLGIGLSIVGIIIFIFISSFSLFYTAKRINRSFLYL